VVIPIVTPEEMGAIDSAAADPVDVLIGRAGAAVAQAARAMLGGTYGRRVVVIAGKGNNGNDGRVAAERLRTAGVHVTELDAVWGHRNVPPCDLVIDAAYGTGFRGAWEPPEVGDVPVLAVDIPSGVDGLTGQAGGGVLAARRTVTFAALKPGLLFPPGRQLAGRVQVADIGLAVESKAHLVEQGDAAAWLPRRGPDAHKWRAAVWVVAGSPGMLGSAHLASRAAQRVGAGMVWLSSPGVTNDPRQPTEVVGRALPADGWDTALLASAERFAALVVGPGLGQGAGLATIRRLLGSAPQAVVLDGDGLSALAGHLTLLRRRRGPTILTPHDGEYSRLTGGTPGADRLEAARRLCASTGTIVLLKGPATVVAEPRGRVAVVDAGDSRLATAGTGDVLSGTIGGLLAQGVPAFEAAALGAWLHGRAGCLGPRQGLVAGDLPDLLPLAMDELLPAWR
jgi:NAD(P)H-hydrate epimerase